MPPIRNPFLLALLLLVLVAVIPAAAFVTPSSALVPNAVFTKSPASSLLRLQEAAYPWEGPLRDERMQKFKTEETLLKLHCKVMHDADLTTQVLPAVQKYVQSFAFAAVLPVQPLQYLPTDDGGVEVTFLRKKTKEKGSVDGGLRFFILEDKPPATAVMGSDDEPDETDAAVPPKAGLEIVVKRNSEGQTCGKMFAEKLVILAFCDSFLGKDRDGKYSSHDPPTHEWVTVESVFHQWMEL